MRHTSGSATFRPRHLSFALLGCAGGILSAGPACAQSINASAPVSSSGINVIETSGVYPTTTNGNNHYMDGGANYTYPSFDVVDFTAGSFGFTAPVTSVSNLSLTVTEADYTASKAGGFAIYLSEDTNSIATANAGAPLAYQTASAPGGVGTQLGTLFQIGSFTSDASTTSLATDTFTLTLTSAAQTYFVNQLNAGSGSLLRLVIASTDGNGYATLDGNTTAVPTASQPTLAFTAAVNQPSLNWTPGGSASGGSGTWLPAGTAGDTSWGGGPWVSANLAVFGGTGGAVAIGTGGVTAQGIQMNTTGYTLGTTGGPAITLTNGGTVQVTNAGDSDTVNAPVAGTVGLNKLGAGTLILGGANTYTGTTTVSAGTLQISADTALGASGNAVALAGGTLQSSLTSGTLTTARGITGSGGLGINSGATLSASGFVNAGTITLPGGGTLVLTNTAANLADSSSNAIGGLVFQTAGASVQTQTAGNEGGYGAADLGSGGITASQASGTVTVASIFQFPTTTTTVPIVVTNAGATLNVSGYLLGAATLVKTGAGTLVLNSDNSGLTGTATASIRQGSATVAGGVISIPASNPNPNAALGTAPFDANGGTLSNNTGTALVFANSISAGPTDSTVNPGGQVFAGTGAMTFTGTVSLYNTGTSQRTMTFNTPTTFSGMFAVSTGTGTATGLTIAGSSTLTLSGTAGANTFTEPVTIATGAGLILAKDGALGANSAITINAGATLTINTGVTTGTVNAVNSAALITLNLLNSTYGKLVFNIGTATETIGGLYLPVGDGTLKAGFQPAGTYGPAGSGAKYQDSNFFAGSSVFMNAATAIPEPGTWAALSVGLLGLAALGGRRRPAAGAAGVSGSLPLRGASTWGKVGLVP